MRSIAALVSALVLLLVTAACAPQASSGQATSTVTSGAAVSVGAKVPTPQVTKAAAAATPVPTSASTAASAAAGSGCFADVPAYPGARADKGKESDLEGLLKGMGGQRDWFPAESHVYLTGDSPDQVLQYFGDALPRAGWKQASKIPGKNWGFVRWSKGDAQAQLLTGQSGDTIIVLGCSVTPPTPTPLAAQALTLKQAFDLLRQQLELSDLAFYSYAGFKVDEGGKTAQYTVSGYSVGQKRFCYIQANGKVVELKCRDQSTVDGPLVEDLGKLKDSSELVAEAYKKNPPCSGGVNLAVNLTQKEAQFLCSGGKWSWDVTPFK